MEMHHMIEEHSGELWSVGRLIARDDVAHLGKAIDEDEEGVVAIGDKGVSDEVAGDSFPWTWGYRKRH
jgi:hypothetical protein